MKRKATQKKQNFRKSSPQQGLSQPRNLKLILAGTALLVVALILLGVFYGSPAAGQAVATGILRSCPGEIDLDGQGKAQLDLSRVPSCPVKVTASLGVDEVYDLTLTDTGEGTVQYLLIDDTGNTLALGLLGPLLTDTRGILLDEDTAPDVEFHFSAGIFEVVNLLFSEVTAPAAPAAGTGVPPLPPIRYTLDLFRTGREAAGQEVPAVFIGFSGESYTVQVNPLAKVKAKLDVGKTDTRVFNVVQRNVTDPTTGVVTLLPSFDFPLAASAGPHQLTFEVLNTSNDVVAQKNYTLAGEGLIYQLQNDPHTPAIAVVLTDEVSRQATVSYTFAATQQKQPFSLPCTGRVNLAGIAVPRPGGSSLPAAGAIAESALSVVTGFNAQLQNPDGWRPEAPSEFYELQSLQGYSLGLKNAQQWQFSAACVVPLKSELPSLVKGWNLVGIAGNLPVKRGDLESSKAPPGMRITSLKELLRDNAVSEEKSELQPGKAYWVLVG